MPTKDFHIGDILTITTGRLVSPRHTEGIYDILNFMTGDDLFTIQLPRASRECKSFLLEQHPQLAEVDASGVNEGNLEKWLAEQAKKFGEMLPVSTIPQEAHEVKNPVQEIVEMMGGPDRVTPVVFGDK